MNTSPSFHSPYLRQVQEVIESTIAGMDYDQMTWGPKEKWSAALILEHLSLAFYRTVQTGRIALKGPDHAVRRATWKERGLVCLVLGLKHFPTGVKAPKMVVPRGIGPQQAREAVIRNLSEMDHILHQCRERFNTEVPCLVHSVLGPLTIRQWCKFHFLHTRHHMKQIQRLRTQFAELYPADRTRRAVAR